jgi:hypothetical protein
MTFAREPGGDLEVVALSRRSNPSKELAAGREGPALLSVEGRLCVSAVARLW